MKCVRTLLPLILMALLLAGCGKGKTNPETGINAAPESSGDGIPFLRLCESGDEEGCYLTQPITGNRANLLYLDYETEQEIFLCSNPSCRHEDDTCTSYLETGENGFPPNALVAGNALLLVQNGPNQEGPAGVWRSEKNGENRRRIYNAEQGQTIGPAFYTDDKGEFLYFQTVEMVKDQGNLYDRKIFMKLDLETGNVTPLCEITGYELSGVFQGKIVLSATEQGQATYHYLTLEPGKEARVEPDAFFVPDSANGVSFLEENAFYQYDQETNILTRNPLDGSEPREYDCTPYAEQPDSRHCPGIRGVYGNDLLYEISRKTPEGYYEQVLRTLDLTTGQFSQPMTLKDSLGNTIVPQGEHGDFFLVIHDYRSAWTDGTKDGVDDMELFLPVYAFITKEDYYNSRPNYRSFSAEP